MIDMRGLCSGQIGFMVCSKAKEGGPTDLSMPHRPPPSAPAGSLLPPLRCGLLTGLLLLGAAPAQQGSN